MKIQVNEGPIGRVDRVVAGIALLAVAILGVVASPSRESPARSASFSSPRG